MGYSKRQFINAAYAELGLASYQYELMPEELELARQRLDALMASWYGNAIRIGYPLPSSPDDGDLDEETNVPDVANRAIIINLAVELAPSNGKDVSVAMRANAQSAYNALLNKFSTVREMQWPSGLPRGAGNKPWRWTYGTFTQRENPGIDAGPDGPLDLE